MLSVFLTKRLHDGVGVQYSFFYLLNSVLGLLRRGGHSGIILHQTT